MQMMMRIAITRMIGTGGTNLQIERAITKAERNRILDKADFLFLFLNFEILEKKK
jgi:hypothetical protein